MSSVVISTLALLTATATDAFIYPNIARVYPPSLRQRTSAVRPLTPLLVSVEEETSADSNGSESISPSLTKEVVADATDALSNVGWGGAGNDMITAGELTSDDPFVRNIDDGIRAEIGVGLDGLLNPAKVVNLERDLYNLRSELASRSGLGLVDVSGLSTEECDGGGGRGEDMSKLRAAIAKKESSLAVERRSVFRGWLKNVFLGQAVISLALSVVMVTDPSVLLGGFNWFYKYDFDQPVRVLGFWWWWLFIVPSLRSRRPTGAEKKALDIAFLGTPAVSLILPAVTKDCVIIWGVNAAVVVGSYAFAFASDGDDGDDNDTGNKQQPEWLKFIYKSLDFGSGRERGVRN